MCNKKRGRVIYFSYIKFSVKRGPVSIPVYIKIRSGALVVATCDRAYG